MTDLVREHAADVKDGVAVVFVHGIGGERHHTWMHDQSDLSSLWPQWLGRESSCDTWTVGYDAELAAWRELTSSLHVHGLAIMDRLATEPELAGRPLILIGHGVGGLLLKKAIVHAMSKGAPRHRKMVGRLQGLTLLATPQSGAELNTLGQALAMQTGTPPQTKDFGAENAQLRALHDEFFALSADLACQTQVFNESKPVVVGKKWLGLLKTKKIVVPPDAGGAHAVGESVMVLPEDHFSISKPRGTDAQLHRAIVLLIDRCKAVPPAPASAQAPNPVNISPIPSVPQIAVPAEVVPDLPIVRPALLSGASDLRLQPCEKKLYGRDGELTRILTFLDNLDERAAVVCSRNVDVGGLGKTELCKAALKIWVGRGTKPNVFFFELPSDADPQAFTEVIARGIGMDPHTHFEQLKTQLPEGLYYLDNVSGLAAQDEGRSLLSALKDSPGVRLLVSSRSVLSVDWGLAIEIEALPKPAALTLFRELWSGGDILPVDTVLGQFIDNDLQRNALDICLAARLGDFFAFEEIARRWRQHHVASVEHNKDHLYTTLKLTAEALAMHAGALPMWTYAASIPDGIDDALLRKFESVEQFSPKTIDFLLHHRIVEKRGGRYHVLAPLARFALESVAGSNTNSY